MKTLWVLNERVKVSYKLMKKYRTTENVVEVWVDAVTGRWIKNFTKLWLKIFAKY